MKWQIIMSAIFNVMLLNKHIFFKRNQDERKNNHNLVVPKNLITLYYFPILSYMQASIL